MKYSYKIKTDELKQLVPSKGYGIVSDKITIDGSKVGFMYREKPLEKEDSGWRFLSGMESQEYVDEPKNSMVFDLNTIANYDEDIIPYLNMPVGTELERVTDTNEFRILQ